MPAFWSKPHSSSYQKLRKERVMVMDIAEEFSRNVQPVWATWGTVSVFLDLDRKHDVSKQDGVCSEFD